MWRRLSIEHNLTHYYVPIIVMYERRYNVYITHYWAHPTHSRTTADTLYIIYHYQLDSLIIADYHWFTPDEPCFRVSTDFNNNVYFNL